MKKTLALIAMVLVIVGSVAAGTLAVYTTTVDDLATGDVVAKEFILLENGSDSFEQNVKIAPTETVSWQFGIKNNDGEKISETAMDVDITLDIAAAADKSAIAPLVVTVKNEGGSVVGTQTGTGTITFADYFSDLGAQSRTYTVEVEWPSNDDVDYQYAGAGFGTAVAVTVQGTQATE